MKTNKFLPRPRHALSASIAILTIIGGTHLASAWRTVDAINAFNAYNNAMYFVLNGNQGYYRVAQGSGSVDSFWHFAEEIEMVRDATMLTNNPTYKNMITQLCTGFTTHNGTDWSNNKFNDDLMWGAIAFCRAYNATGNGSYLTIAENNFNTAYNRGWDSVSGGMWQSTDKISKNACVNYPAAIAGYCISSDGGGSGYLTKAQNTYNWAQANLYNATTGKVSDSTISGSSFSYNQGTCIGAAYFLGDFNTCAMSATYTMNNLGTVVGSYRILPEYGTGGDGGGFNGIFLRWTMRFVTGRGAQATYQPWLQANVTQAWSLRRTADELSWCQWVHQTPSGNLYAWDCTSTVVGMLTVPATQ
jgi:predicted alpha-1,6-mannanase (GH76 family)